MRKGGAATIRGFVRFITEEAVAEGIKAEVAFVQAMKETGWLQFTGVVKAESSIILRAWEQQEIVFQVNHLKM